MTTTKEQERQKVNRKRAVGQQITGGALMAGGATVNEVLDGRLRTRGSAPTVSALVRTAQGKAGGFTARTHVPHIAGKMASRGMQLASLPLMAAGTKNLISGKDTKPVHLTRDVVKPVFHYATLQDEVARGEKQLNMKVTKLLDPTEQATLSRHKRVGRDLSLVSGTLGLTALGLRAPQAAAALERRGVKGLTGLARHSKRATSASNTLGVGAIGIGSAGSFNYAAQQKLERKRDVTKAQGEYFRAPAPLERDSGRRRRVQTESEHQAWRATAAAAGTASTAAVGARWLGHKNSPAVVAAAGRYARTQGVPKDTVVSAQKKLNEVGHWAKGKRGRLLAGALTAGAVSTGAGAVARWKKDEVQGVSQDLGRAASGRDYSVRKAGVAAAGLEVGAFTAKKVQTLSPAAQRHLAHAVIGGTAVATAGATATGFEARRRRLRSERAQFRERTQPVPVGKGDANPATVAAATAGGAFAGHMANFGGHYAFNELHVKPKFQRGRETWTRDQKKAWGRHVNNVPEGMTGEQYRTGKQFFRNFPKELPGSGARRMLGWTQKGKTGHTVAAASMATGALIANRAASREHVKKGALSYVPKSRMLEDGVKGALILRDPGFLMPVAGVTTAGVAGGVVAARKRRRNVSKALPDKMFHAGRWRRVLGYDARAKQVLLDNHSDPGMPYRVSRGGQKVPKPTPPPTYEQGELFKSYVLDNSDRVSPGAVKWWNQARHERNDAAASAAGNASLAGLSGWMLHHEVKKRPASKPAVAITAASGLAAAYGAVRSGQKVARRQKSMKVVEEKARQRTAAGLYGPGRGLSPVDASSHNYRKHEGAN